MVARVERAQAQEVVKLRQAEGTFISSAEADNAFAAVPKKKSASFG